MLNYKRKLREGFADKMETGLSIMSRNVKDRERTSTMSTMISTKTWNISNSKSFVMART